MYRALKTTGKYWMALSLLLLAACSTATATPAAPTADLNLLRTEVAATVLAQCAAVCALTPSATIAPTITPTQTLAPSPSAAAPTPTIGTPAAGSGNRLEWVAQNIADGTRLTPGAAFNITWRVKNTGILTWTANYRLRFYGGNRFGAPEEVLLNQEVAPGQEADISIPMQAPAAAGEYRSDWVMADAASSNFNEPLFLIIIVVGPGTVVPTLPPPTATNTLPPVATSAETPAATAQPTAEATAAPTATP